jgi:hypothetical protein
MTLIDIDYFRRQPLGTKDVLPTETVQEYIEEASQYVKDYLDREIELANYTERIVGSGGYSLILDETPVTNLIDVSYVGYESDMGTHSTGDFILHSGAGIIEWVNKRYNFRTDRVYIVQYEAGYATIPGPIKRATALQTVQLMRPMYGGVQVETPDVVPFAEELIVSLLEKYRRKRLS